MDRMKQEQDDIYHITGESIAVVSSSPFVENLRKRGLEAHHIVDPADEHAVQRVKEFGGKMLKSTTKERLDLGDEDGKKTLEELKAEFESLAELMNGVPGDKVEEAIVDDRTFDSLRAHTMSEHGVPVDRERIMKAQAPVDNANVSMSAFDRLERQQHSSQQQQQPQTARQSTRQEREKERESVRKGQRGRGQEGRKEEEEREAEKGGSEQIEKDVTGWTEVTRKKRRKMVQIFVKVNGSKATSMEVSLTDDKKLKMS